MKLFLCGLVIGLIGGVFALQNHVVRTSDGVVVVARTTRPPLRSTYVDVRDWSATMWTQYPEVAAAVVQAGRSDLITQNALGNFLNGPGDNRGTPATSTSTSSLFEAPIRLLQQSTTETQPSNIPVPQAEQYSPPPVAIPQTTPVAAPSRTLDLLPTLGESAPFPSQYQHPSQMELVLPRDSSVNPTQHSTMTVVTPLTETAPRSVAPASPPAIQDRAAGADPEWVRGLLKSLIPEPGAATPSTQNTSTGTSAPAPGANAPPATAGDFWKPASYQQLIEPLAPMQAVRPF